MKAPFRLVCLIPASVKPRREGPFGHFEPENAIETKMKFSSSQNMFHKISALEFGGILFQIMAFHWKYLATKRKPNLSVLFSSAEFAL